MLRATRTFHARGGFVAVRLQCMEASSRRAARALRHSPSAAGARPAAPGQVREHMAVGEVLNRRFRKENLIL
jgi:hypothetical protein